MAQGYWDHGYMGGCPCCRSGAKDKYICLECLHVTKGIRPVSPTCPTCRTPMKNMGQRWRPSKKSKRTMPEIREFRWYPPAGVVLLERLTSEKRRVDGNHR